MTAVVSRRADVSASAVFAVLADPWSYAAWVVGASRVRDVEGDWPEDGATIHHSVGVWPLLVNDRTSVVATEDERRVELDVALWFLGRGRVVLELRPEGPDACHVTMTESMYAGLMAKLPDALVDPLLNGRNRETLRRLEDLARGRAARA